MVTLGVGLEFWDLMISSDYTFGFSFLTEKLFSIIFYFVGWNKGTKHRGFVSGYAWKLSENYFSPFFLFGGRGCLIALFFLFFFLGCCILLLPP